MTKWGILYSDYIITENHIWNHFAHKTVVVKMENMTIFQTKLIMSISTILYPWMNASYIFSYLSPVKVEKNTNAGFYRDMGYKYTSLESVWNHNIKVYVFHRKSLWFTNFTKKAKEEQRT